MNRNLAKRIVDASLPTNKRVPEIYVTTEGTEGLIFNITNTDLVFYYRYKDKNNNEVDGNSMVSVTKEVVQMNHVINGWNTGTVLKNNDTAAFIHAPAMIFAQVAFPNSFVKKLPSIQGLNTVNLNLPCIGPNAKRFSDPMPNYVLVMKKSEVP
ncbi:MAG TPA: hypothetical protein DDY68_00165, partial [Porphyromonadaceae bacterium]|nr:hypothetical protein [Porphyromonadaceae bacterium]